MKQAKADIFTIGHSTRTLKEFLDILKNFKISQLVDIRTIPYSKYTPQFNMERLSKALAKSKIKYLHLKGLGGLRHPAKDSINSGWRNSSFRGFADYMQTGEFDKNLKKLILLAKKRTTAIMCAEAVPWRCHRSLVADALGIRKIKVFHIMSLTNSRKHKLTSFAKIKGKRIFYPS